MKSDASLLLRIGVGVLVFAALALSEWRRRGRQATRWREYLFLLGCAGAALVYGAIGDQVTVTISPEYFLYGKALAEVVKDPGSQVVTPELRWEAAKVGLKATWTAGLILGVVILLANNPRRGRPQLAYRELWARLPVLVGVAAICAIVLGVIGYWGGFVRFSNDFQQMVQRDEFRPRRFMAVFGIHLGGYVGGLIGTVAVVAMIVRRRRKMGAVAAREGA